jgi:hypothetical protein
MKSPAGMGLRSETINPMNAPIRQTSLALFAVCAVLQAAPAPRDTAGDAARWWSHVEYLADDRMEGRLTGSPGHRKAAEYVAGEFERAGLEPGGTSAYFQPVRFRTQRIVEEKSGLELIHEGRATSLTLGDDAYIGLRNDVVPKLQAPVVFAGYGLRIPELKHDDLAGLDVRGKIVLYVSGTPKGFPGALSSHYQSSAERWKALREAGAIGVASIPNPANREVPWSRSSAARLSVSMLLEDPSLAGTQGQKLALVLNPERADAWFAGAPRTAKEILDLAIAGKPLPSFPLDVTVRAKTSVKRGRASSENVIGILPGSDPQLRDEYVVLSAHIDHLGIGAPVDGDSIYNGAMDNASGIASLIEIARLYRESGIQPRRSLIFLACTGEERGLLGSQYFAAYPSITGRLVANVNMDMYLPLIPLRYLVAYGIDESSLAAHAYASARELGIELQKDPEPNRNVFIRSDQYSFIKRGIPALNFKFGYLPGTQEEKVMREWYAKRYHGPADDLTQPVDKEAAVEFNRFLASLIRNVADDPTPPAWNQDSFFARYAREDAAPSAGTH